MFAETQSKVPELNLSLHAKQSELFYTPATEVLYGGAAGGGKSHAIRVCSIVWASLVPNLQIFFFRKTYPELYRNHMLGEGSFPALLSPLRNSGHVQIVKSEIRFWNGSKIHLCHCEDEIDIFKYLGAEIHVLVMDEATHFTNTQYRFLRSRVRISNLSIPEDYKDKFPRIILCSNPGGVGHGWIKKAFIDSAPEGVIHRAEEREGGFLRQYIRAVLADNPSLNDGYRTALMGLGSETLVRAMLNGDWDVVEGAYFTQFDREKHVIRPFAIPQHWPRFTAMDWGSAKPFCVLWFAISDGTISKIPKGALVVYKEFYGGDDNKGLKWPATLVAREMKKRLGNESFIYHRADPSMFKEDGDDSLAQKFSKEGIKLSKADNTRVTGWDAVSVRLTGDDDGPQLLMFSTCLHLIRTLPYLQHDKNRPEDIDTDMEDHAADALRYGCMSRVRPRELKTEETPIQFITRVIEQDRQKNTFNNLLKSHLRICKKRRKAEARFH